MPNTNTSDPSVDSFDDAEILSMSDGDMYGPSDVNSEQSFAYGPGNISLNLGSTAESTSTMFSPILDSNFRNATSLHDSVSGNALPRLPHAAIRSFTYPSGSKTAASGLTFYLLGCNREAVAEKVLLPIAAMFPPELEYTLAWVPPKFDSDEQTPSSSFIVPRAAPIKTETDDTQPDDSGDDTKTGIDYQLGDNTAQNWASELKSGPGAGSGSGSGSTVSGSGSGSTVTAAAATAADELVIYKFSHDDRSFSLLTSEPATTRRAVVLLYYEDSKLDMEAELRKLERPVLRSSPRTGVLRAVSRMRNPLLVPVAPHILDPKAYVCESVITSSNAPLLEVEVDRNSSQYRAKVPLTTALLHKVKLEEFSVPRGQETTLQELNDPKSIPWLQWLSYLLIGLVLMWSYSPAGLPNKASPAVMTPTPTPPPQPLHWAIVEKHQQNDFLGDAWHVAHKLYGQADTKVRGLVEAADPYVRHAVDMAALGLDKLKTLIARLEVLVKHDVEYIRRGGKVSAEWLKRAWGHRWDLTKAKLHAKFRC